MTSPQANKAAQPPIAQPPIAQPPLSQHSLHHKELESCAQGVLPVRYSRNGALTSPAQQALLLRARVLLVGLGGLGGHVLDTLIRMGVGHITGVDGDSFEASNLNRQLLCTHETLGMPKAQAAAAHVARVNPATHFVPVARFVRGAELHALVRGEEMDTRAGREMGLGEIDHGVPITGAEGIGPRMEPEMGPEKSSLQGSPKGGYDLVVDALGGLDDRAALHAAAQAAGIPVVTAGIAGLTGWVQVVGATATSPMHYFSQHIEHSCPPSGPAAAEAPPQSPSAEVLLGNLAPTVCVAAGLQCAQVLALLTGAQPSTEILVFDLQDLFFTTLHQAGGGAK